jgi:predicted flavoprotein YhiN
LATGARGASFAHAAAATFKPEKLAAMDTAVAEAISTAGGVKYSEINPQSMLLKRSGVYCAGEMVDWEAPTGGYLLTACLASGRAAGLGILTNL